MSDLIHTLDIESDDGRELLMVCPGCGRRLVLKRPQGDGPAEMVVIDRGDFAALHEGGIGPLRVCH